MKILLVDDEEKIEVLVEMIVTKKGYDFCYADNGEDALEVYEKERPDLIILDVMMPKLNGFEVCKILRDGGSPVPIIILSAKGDIVDKSMGFTMGADDYLVKPFSPQELLLRIEAHLRKHKRENIKNYDTFIGSDELDYVAGDLEISFKKHEIRVCGKLIDLTPREFKILSHLVTHPGEVFSKKQLQEYMWGENYAGELAAITVIIRKIREKIEVKPSKPKYILTVWGIGYKYSEI